MATESEKLPPLTAEKLFETYAQFEQWYYTRAGGIGTPHELVLLVEGLGKVNKKFTGKFQLHIVPAREYEDAKVVVTECNPDKPTTFTLKGALSLTRWMTNRYVLTGTMYEEMEEYWCDQFSV